MIAVLQRVREARVERGSLEDDFIEVDIDRLRYVERSIRSNQLGAEHQFGIHHNLVWKLTSSGVTRTERGVSCTPPALRTQMRRTIPRDGETGGRAW